MNKRRKKILWLLVLSVLTAAYFLRFFYINHLYPETVTREYQMNQSVPYNGVEIQVVSCRLLEGSDWRQIETAYHKDIDEGVETKCLVPEIQIKNTSSQAKEIRVSSFSAQSGAWRNGINLETLAAMNAEKENRSSTIMPGQTVTMKLPYVMSSSQFGQQNWSTVRQRDFQLVLSLYPVKQTVKLRY